MYYGKKSDIMLLYTMETEKKKIPSGFELMPFTSCYYPKISIFLKSLEYF